MSAPISKLHVPHWLWERIREANETIQRLPETSKPAWLRSTRQPEGDA